MSKKPKRNGNLGVPKSKYHRARIRSSMRAFWKRTREAIALADAREHLAPPAFDSKQIEPSGEGR